MRKRKIAPNAYTYMGVLKALSHMRDGISAVQVRPTRPYLIPQLGPYLNPLCKPPT
jgi:hypothetical protein